MSDETIKMAEIAIEGLLPAQGVFLLGGRPKDCKSWLAVQMCCALVTGLPLGGKLEVLRPGRAHLWALEDQFSLTKDKLLKLYPDTRPDHLNDLRIFAELPHPLVRGGAEIIQRELDRSPAQYVILDSLMKLTGERQAYGDIVQADYAVIDCARKLALKNHILVGIVMHTRKGSQGGAPIENLMGTTGTTAAADVLMELKKTGRTGKLSVRGRCLPSEDFNLAWWDSETWGWGVQGKDDDLTLGEVGADVVAYLEAQGASRPGTIAAGLHKPFGAVWQSLQRLQARGLITLDLSKRWMAKV